MAKGPALAAGLVALVGAGLALLLLTGDGAAPGAPASPEVAAPGGTASATPRVDLSSGGAGPGDAVAAASVPSRVELAVGDVREHTFRFSTRLVIGSNQGAVDALATRAAGTLTISCYAASADELLLGQRWSARSLALEGQEGVSKDAVARDVATELLLKIDRRGRLRGLALPERGSTEGRNLLRALVAVTLAGLPERAAPRWEAEGYDPIGPCTDAFTLDAQGVARRSRRIRAANGLEFRCEQGLTFAFAPDGLLQRVGGDETTHVGTGDAGVGMILETSPALERTGARKLTPEEAARALASAEAALGPGAWRVGGAPEPADPATAHRARREPRELEALLSELGLAVPEDGEVSGSAPALFIELADRFKDDPAAVARALALLQADRLPPGVAATVIDALGEAQTEVSQRALLTLATSSGVNQLVVPNVFLGLANAPAPLPEVVAALERLAKGEDPLRAEWATQGMGVLASKAAPALGDRLAQAIEQGLGANAQDDRVLLEALGNAGRERSRQAVLGYTKTEDPELRATAVSALRKLEGPEVDAALVRSLADPSDLVRSAGVRAFGARGVEAGSGQVTRALQGDVEPVVRIAALEVLVDWIAEAPPEQDTSSLRALVERAAQSDAAPEVREFATNALNGGGD